MLRLLLLALIFFSMPSFAANTTAVAPGKFENFYLSAVPTVAELKRFKADGGSIVVDLRGFDEKSKDCGEVITATKLGLKYFAAPMPKTAPLTEDTVRQVNELVAKAGEKPILIHCASQQRAAAWLAVHLVRTRGLSVEQAIEKTKPLGLDSDHMQEAVRDFLGVQHVVNSESALERAN